jgi:ribosomal protein S18 acetylase RimI-like enzyme
VNTSVHSAGVADVEEVALLFDAYRQFYGRPSDVVLARQFLTERLSRSESIVLVARSDDTIASGFVQLFPAFSSVRAARIYVLNDLYVIPQARRSGIGRLLMEAAARTARDTGAVRLKLSTAASNIAAQNLYESLGWVRDDEFYEYNLLL